MTSDRRLTQAKNASAAVFVAREAAYCGAREIAREERWWTARFERATDGSAITLVLRPAMMRTKGGQGKWPKPFHCSPRLSYVHHDRLFADAAPTGGI